MKIYLDGEYRCHALPADGLREAESALFEGKCAGFVEGYRLVPAGESWTRADGTVFHGEMIAPAEDSRTLERIQTQHEADEQDHLSELGSLIEEIYNEYLEVIEHV